MGSEEWALEPGRGGLRTVRAVVTAAPSVALAVAAHAVGGGCVALLGVLVTAAVLTAATYPMITRERSATFFLSWTAAGQVLAHGILDAFCHHDVAPRATAHVMLLAHAGAVLLLGLTLRLGEARLWAPAALARVLRQQLRVLAGVLAGRTPSPRLRTAGPVQPVGAAPPPRLRLALWVSRCRAHRGPPQVLLGR